MTSVQARFDSAAPTGASLQQPCGTRPEVFLFAPWEGKGVICDAFGIRYDDYRVDGCGVTDADGMPCIHYNITFGRNGVSRHVWRVRRDTGRKIVADDIITGAVARGLVTENGFFWGAPARIRTPLGVRRAHVEIAYAVRADGDADTDVTVRLWGVTVGAGKGRITRTGQQARRSA